MKKNRFSLFFLMAMCFCSVAIAQNAVYGDSVVAMVGEEAITSFQVRQACRIDERRLLSTVPIAEQAVALKALYEEVLERLIANELVYLEYKSLKVDIPKTFMMQRLDRIIMEQAGGDRTEFENMLHAENMTMTEFQERLQKDICVEALLNDRVRRGIQFSEPQIREYYEQHKDEYIHKASYHLYVIMLRGANSDKEMAKKIKQIRKSLDEGMPFEEVAWKYSEGSNAENGGDQGWMTEMNEKLLSEVQKMEPGQVCQNDLQLGNNVYIVRLAEMIPEKTGELNDELMEKIRKILTEAEEDRRYDSFMDELRMKYPVRRMDN